MLYSPATAYMFEWWRKRRGLSTGIMFAGTGVGGLIMPILCAELLHRFGRRITLISIVGHAQRIPAKKAIAYAALLGALLPSIQPRVPPAAQPRLQWGFLTSTTFWLLWCGVLCQGLAAFMPGTYLPGEPVQVSVC